MVAWIWRLGLLSVIGLTDVGGGGASFVPVAVDRLEVYDRPDERSFETGRLERGDRVRVRVRKPGGWAVIDPPATAIGWVERASLALGDEGVGRGSHRRDPGDSRSGLPTRARVVATRALVRSGRLGALRPGLTWVELPRGTMVQLVDRPPVTLGRGPDATLWFAIVPPDAAACYVRDEGLGHEEVAERLASYLVPDDRGSPGPSPASESLPAGVAAEIGRVDAMHRGILAHHAIDQWRFEAVRAEYQAIMKRSGDSPAVEEALRGRLARLTRHEQAAAAAREFREVLDRSRQRDGQIARVEERLAAVDRYRTRSYHAVGVVQPSSRLVDGRKLHVLIDPEGRTIAYLDIPPGVDLDAIGARRVGIRGAVHYNSDLGTRLITVRDLEPVGTRR